ncbi:MAG: pallilysin-related adhesin [Treponema sp.]|jgi:hypothetical protein|nr:pallilysin-related adhesin [Treponema sp.]
MDFRFSRIITTLVFILAGLSIIFLIVRPLDRISRPVKSGESSRTRVVLPGEAVREPGQGGQDTERMAYEDSVKPRVSLEDGELAVQILSQDFDGDSMDEQIIAYRNLLEIESPLYITYIEYEARERTYRRVWSAPTAATRPGTLSLYTMDLIGDRSLCILVNGMNGAGEHTLTIFRKNIRDISRDNSQDTSRDNYFNKIAEIRIDGSISVKETERTQAYQSGVAPGRSFSISAYGHDYGSENLLDQIEISYTYNPVNGLYEQSGTTRVPGTQIEQHRLRELLSGTPGVFEQFINDLWYYVSPEGTVERDQYIFFDPASREVIFFGDETQQVFTWQNSNATRYGLYISSQNLSVSTLRRSIDIELESLDSIRVKVFEDVRLRINVNDSWDGSYRRAGTVEKGAVKNSSAVEPFANAVYESPLGTLYFSRDGAFELHSVDSPSAAVRRGHYVFFRINSQRLLELRFQDRAEGSGREIYAVEDGSAEGSLSLSPVRLGSKGVIK